MSGDEEHIEAEVAAYKQALGRKQWCEAGECARSVGNALREVGELEEACAWHRKEIDCWTKAADLVGLAGAHRFLGVGMTLLGDYKDALAHHRKGLALAKSQGRKGMFEKANALMNIAWNAMLEYKETEKETDLDISPSDAILYYEKSISVSESQLSDKSLSSEMKREFKDLLSDSCYNMGLDLEFLNRFQEAVSYHFKSIGYADVEDSSRVVRAYISLGSCYHKLGNLRDAKTNFRRGREQAVSREDKLNASTELAKFLYHIGEYREALPMFQSQRKYASVVGDTDSMQEADEFLKELSRRLVRNSGNSDGENHHSISAQSEISSEKRTRDEGLKQKLRVKMSFDAHSFWIPVEMEEGRTVSWLKKEANRRLKQIAGVSATFFASDYLLGKPV